MLLLPRADDNNIIPTQQNCLLVILVTTTVCILAWIAVSLRAWTKWQIVRIVGYDDWTMFFSLAFFTVEIGAVLGIVFKISGSDGFVPLKDLLISVTLLTVSECFYIVCILTLKISLSIFYLRLTFVWWQRVMIYGSIACHTVFSVALIFYAIFQCGTYNDVLEFALKRYEGRCVSNSSVLGMVYTHAGLTMMTDWMFLLMPFFLFRGSLMSRKEKITIGCVLAFASISGIASIIRFKYIKGLTVPTVDFFRQAKGFAIWSTVEPGIGIIAASLITLRPLFRRVMATSRSRSKGNEYAEIENNRLPLPRLEVFFDKKLADADEENVNEVKKPSVAPRFLQKPDSARVRGNGTQASRPGLDSINDKSWFSSSKPEQELSQSAERPNVPLKALPSPPTLSPIILQTVQPPVSPAVPGTAKDLPRQPYWMTKELPMTPKTDHGLPLQLFTGASTSWSSDTEYEDGI